ncbi:hypothetical protein ACLESO_51060 [Pyxidicoccus sp. 3LG]
MKDTRSACSFTCAWARPFSNSRMVSPSDAGASYARVASTKGPVRKSSGPDSEKRGSRLPESFASSVAGKSTHEPFTPARSRMRPSDASSEDSVTSSGKFGVSPSRPSARTFPAPTGTTTSSTRISSPEYDRRAVRLVGPNLS